MEEVAPPIRVPFLARVEAIKCTRVKSSYSHMGFYIIDTTSQYSDIMATRMVTVVPSEPPVVSKATIVAAVVFKL